MNEEQPINIDTTPQEPPSPENTPINLDESSTVPLLSQGTVDSRSMKAYLGFGSIVNKSYADIQSDISSGQEAPLREGASAAFAAKNAQAKQELVTQLINKNGGITPEDANKIFDPNAPHNQFIDPSTVVEKSYGHYAIRNTLAEARQSMGDTLMDDAEKEVPKSTEDELQGRTTSVAKREYAITGVENAQSAKEGLSTWQRAKNIAVSWGSMGIADDIRLRGNVEGVSAIAGLGIGNNLYEQAQHLRDLPFDEFKAKYDAAMKILTDKDPDLAIQFGQAVVGLSSSDISRANLGTAVTFGTIPGLGTAGKLGFRALGLSAGVKKLAGDIAGSTVIGSEKATLLRGAGDLKGAATEQVASKLERDMKGTGDPIKDSQQGLLSSWQTFNDTQKPGKAPGLGQDLVNRINEKATSSFNNLWDAVMKVSKVQRISEFLSSKQAVKDLFEEIKNTYTGNESTVGDLEVVTNPEATNHYVKFRLLRHDGTEMTSVREAVNLGRLLGVVTKPPAEYLAGIEKRIADLEGIHSADEGGTFATEAKLSELREERDRLKNSGGFYIKETKKEVEGTGTQYQKYLDKGDFSHPFVEQKGLGYYIEMVKPINETSPLVRSYLATTQPGRTPFTFVNTLIGKFRTPNETISQLERIRREAATFGPNRLLEEAQREAGGVNVVPKKYWDDWERVVDFARNDNDPATGEKGHFFDSVADLEDHYLRFYQRPPTAPEAEAYFAFKRLVEVDRVYRSMLLYTLKSRWGAEQHMVSFFDKMGNKLSSNFFEGRIQKTMPGGEAGVAIVGRNGVSYRYANEMNKKMRDDIFKDVTEGKRFIVAVYDTEARPLKNFGDLGNNKVEYIITDRPPETKPLSYETQVPRRGGGHFDYDYDHYIKQARIRVEKIGQGIRHWYEGDATVMPMAIRRMGQDVAKHLNAVRELLKAGDMDGAKAYNAAHLPIPWAEHHGWYLPTKDAKTGEINPPHLSMDEPFHVVPRGKSIADMGKEYLEDRFNYFDKNGLKHNSLRDGTKQGNPARQSAVQYTGERDAFDMRTITDKGSRGNPLYAYEPAKLVDPIPTMNRSLAGIINSFFMDNMKVAAVENWMKEAGNWLAPDRRDLEHSPMWHFNHPEWKPSAPEEIKRLLESNRQKIQSFVGIPSKWDTMLHSLAQNAADEIYGRTGKITPMWLLHSLRDPFQFIRSAVFTEKLGFWNPASFFTQAMTHVNVMGMAGLKNANKGLFNTLLFQYSRHNSSPEILAHLDKLASRWGARPGEWLEARQGMINSGFFKIGHEYSLVDDIAGNKVITSKGQKIIDFSTVFFREGAQNTRGTSWFAAYHEWRDLHPTAKITEDDWGLIRSRASIFDHNMNRSANNILNQGIMSLPGQFLTYHKNIVELMTGKQLSKMEKARLFGVNVVMYGLPSGLALYDIPGSNLLPWSEENFKETAKKYGYVVGDNFIADTLMKGLPALMLASITGAGDPHKGNWYNVEEKWGPGNYDSVNEALDGSRPIWNFLGGASYSTFANTWAASSDFRQTAMAFIRGNSKMFPPKPDTFINLFTQISTVSELQKIRLAFNTGHWISVNGTYLGDTSKMNAIFQSVTGLQDHYATDPNIQEKLIKADKANEQLGERNFLKQYQLGIQALANHDPEQATQYFTMARTWLEATGYPERKRGELVRIANESYGKPLKEKLDYSLLRNAPAGEEQQRLDTYIKEVKQRKNKETP